MKQLHILVIFTIILGSWNLDAVAQNATFTDANLAAAVRAYLDLAEGADIPLSLVQPVESISLADFGITNLTGLEQFVALTGLDLSENPIGDFTPISSLTSLDSLDLVNTGFSDSDLPILAPLTQLTHLGLQENEISALLALVAEGHRNQWNGAPWVPASHRKKGLRLLTSYRLSFERHERSVLRRLYSPRY